jgi:hypothetical protein
MMKHVCLAISSGLCRLWPPTAGCLCRLPWMRMSLSAATKQLQRVGMLDDHLIKSCRGADMLETFLKLQ